jgi:4-alpha-glucanotransferase
MRARFGFPGMAILQFAFGTDPQGPGFRPHNYTRRLVVYTGTHDNDTAVGWWRSGVGDSTRSAADVAAERDFAAAYLDLEGREVHWAMIRAILASVADAAVTPLQDVLGLGSEARMNVPARPSGNWRWRFTWEQLDAATRDRLRELTRVYGRLPASTGEVVPAAGQQQEAS